MKRCFLLALLGALLSACSGVQEQESSDVIVINNEDVANNLHNDTVTVMDVLMANFQNVPVMPIGTPMENVIEAISLVGLTLVERSNTEIVVLGSAKAKRVDGASITVKTVDKFRYEFSRNILTAGPNVVEEN